MSELTVNIWLAGVFCTVLRMTLRVIFMTDIEESFNELVARIEQEDDCPPNVTYVLFGFVVVFFIICWPVYWFSVLTQKEKS